jgi:hypothetical protein
MTGMVKIMATDGVDNICLRFERLEKGGRCSQSAVEIDGKFTLPDGC